MHRARVCDEVQSRQRIPGEKFGWEEIAFESVTPSAGEDDVARCVRAAVRERVHVIERREIELQCGSAIDASAAAVAHRGVFDRSFLGTGRDVFGSAGAR